MKKVTFYAAVLFSAMTMFSACSSKSDDPTPEKPSQEELDQKRADEMIVTADSTFQAIVDGHWVISKFEPSKDLEDASKTQDGAAALTLIKKAAHVRDFLLEGSFAKENDTYAMHVDVNLDESKLDDAILDYQEEVQGMPKDWGMVFPKEQNLAEIRRIMAAPFAQDDAAIEDVTNDQTGLVVLKIKGRDFKGSNYETMLEGGRKLIADNGDKLYFEGNNLVVEVSNKEYGISRWVFAPAK